MEIPRFGWRCYEPWLRGDIASVLEKSMCLLNGAG